ncbi:metal-dependent hydrolase [Isoalcanivorax indicus]|uniref:metal-dependent hydrolase n=1 Tax=Isoalcanivorax indicus TaxID=2202653 RepID=UPI000DB9CA41|nr:metal-dependent hydrolase [Isoalcanivorax indicus]
MSRSNAVKKPDQVSITPQRMGFTFDDAPRYWCRNDPVLTHFLNALSLTFPDGERFFVDAVRAFRDTVTDPQRQKDISGFIGQEAMHSLEHDTFNQMLASQGYQEEAEGGQKLARYLINEGRKRLSKEQQLAATAALEHITAILANRLLKDPSLLADMHPSVRQLWMWHAIEEIEHKAVAYDLYQDVVGSYRMRVRTLLAATLALGSYTSKYTWAFLKKDGMHRRPLVLARGLWRLFGINGMLTRTLPDFISFLRPDFHPWQEDNSALIEAWRAQLTAIENGEATQTPA